MSVTSNLKEIQKTIPRGVALVAVSKFHPIEAMREAYDAGQRLFGESKVQEMSSKYDHMPADTQWHFIGHLQTNKVKSLIPYVHTIHSVDSLRLLDEIEKQASLAGRIVNCLLEVHIANEKSKFGFTFDECREILVHYFEKKYIFAHITGLMGMATNTNDETLIRQEFKSLKTFFDEVKEGYFLHSEYFTELSMGMSHDYKIAVEEGSTMVRIGTSIFGDREY